ncbi:MAG: tRNA (N(6)-L-threonylcarbamoyladenosine(37)-C(2))-methylthiotransferase MtaB [Pseudolabrys sp.]|nr:tRNA (N(6)-L-threonylcarbamoyladenosine(37)-C(2))-methylthiotransferase MtaB [Pseudolabrys sp.]MBV9261974.1 tRNA (N(6)-L-threonylcarbamoyladenosine(37)-C(2))-methylthiotransferase MtaB [Pseudolabrys sp.]
MSLDVITFGCRLNAYESEAIRHQAGELGDTVVINSCAVTGEAVAQARQTIRRVRRERPQARIVVTGCAAQTQTVEFAAMPEVDRVLGNVEKLDARAWRGDARVAVSDIMRETKLAAPVIDGLRGKNGNLPRAFVQIQNGCDHRCTFCVIPYGRGNSRSLAPTDVVAQVRRIADNGCPEVVLTGVDITSYDGGIRLGALVKRVLREVPTLQRLRLSSIDSVEADDDLLDALATEPRLMPHLHLSLQHGDDMILKRMKRRHSRADAVMFCDRVRALRPDVAFSADIIAGFPTETEAMFGGSLDLVDDCGLTQLHVFPFSPRPGTPAARMPQVARDIVKDRARRLRDKGEAALCAHLQNEVGAWRKVLAESAKVGRTEQFVPVRLATSCMPGTMLDVAIAAHDGRQLLAA